MKEGRKDNVRYVKRECVDEGEAKRGLPASSTPCLLSFTHAQMQAGASCATLAHVVCGLGVTALTMVGRSLPLPKPTHVAQAVAADRPRGGGQLGRRQEAPYKF